jgi:hypothetical protein
MRTRAIIVLAPALLCGPIRSAWADAEADRVRAAARFGEAKGDMGRGDFASACPKLAESEALDPQVGTLLNLAYCYENVGKTATALSTWMEAASFAAAKKQQGREQFALLRAHWLEPHLLRVTIRVAPQPAYDSIALTVDGAAFERSRWGVPVPMDRGEYEVRAEAPGFANWSSHFSVDEGHAPTIAVPVLAPVVPPATQPSSPIASDQHEGPSAAAFRRESVSNGRRPALLSYAIIAGGVGLAALAVGGTFGIAGIINANEASNNKVCASSACLDAHNAENRRAIYDGDAADMSFAVAAAAGATGLILWLAAGSGHAPPGHVSIQAGVAPGLASVTVGGPW